MTTKSTAKDRVFDYLYERIDQWVDGPVLIQPQVGGTEGLRRLREARVELRNRGFRIEGPRRHPTAGRNTRQYRLVRVTDISSVYIGKDEQPTVTPVATATEYLCPRPTCAHTLSSILKSEFDTKFGFGTCPVHGMQQVRL